MRVVGHGVTPDEVRATEVHSKKERLIEALEDESTESFFFYPYII